MWRRWNEFLPNRKDHLLQMCLRRRRICVIEVSSRINGRNGSNTNLAERLLNIVTMLKHMSEGKTNLFRWVGNPNRDESAEEDSKFGRSLLENPFHADERVNNRRTSNVSNDEDDVNRRRNLDWPAVGNPVCAMLTNEDSRIDQMWTSHVEDEYSDGVFHQHRTVEDKSIDFWPIGNIFRRTDRNLSSRSNESRHETFDNNQTRGNRNDDSNQRMEEVDQQHWNTQINRWTIRCTTILMLTSMNEEKNDVWQRQGCADPIGSRLPSQAIVSWPLLSRLGYLTWPLIVLVCLPTRSPSPKESCAS